MPVEIMMPRLSEEVAEGVVVQWKVSQGQQVEKGQVLVEVETDKAIVEVDAPASGVLAVQAAQAGEPVPAGALLAVLAGAGESADEIRKRYAGRGGAGEAAPPPPQDAGDVLRTIPLHGLRGAIAARMSLSKSRIPHYQVTMDCDAEALLAARRKLKRNKRTRDISANAIILKCVAAALKQHPMVNATLEGGVIYQRAGVHIAAAVAVPEGVVAPVVRDVAGKSLLEVSVELDELAEAARGRRLRPEQLRGGTFTVSTLGSYGVRDFTAIIVPPQVAILAVGTIRTEPVVRDGEIVPGKRIALTLSADHRAVDGAVAAEFLYTLRAILEDPAAALA